MKYRRHLTALFPTLLLLLAASAAGPALAQNNFDLDDLEDGQLVLNLNASEQVEVDQDTLNASLQFMVQGRDSVDIQSQVNAAMQQAVALLEESEGVEYSISRYSVYPVQVGRPTRNDIDNPVWRAQQSVQLTGTDSTALLARAGELQKAGFTMGNLYYSLSTARYEELSDSLLVAVLAKLQGKADLAADALGKSSAEIIELSINGSQPFFAARAMPMQMAMDSAESFSMPVAEPGKSQVSLNVSARVLVSP